MSNFIMLTVVTTELKQETTDSILRNLAGRSDNSSKKDSYGRDADFYTELGIDVPEELNDSIQEDDSDNDLYDIIEAEGAFRPETITFAVANKDIGSTIYIDVDYKIAVKESLAEIIQKIKQSTNN